MRKVLSGVKGLSYLLLALAGSAVLASGEVLKSPILDRVKVLYAAPANLESLTLDQLHAEKAALAGELAAIQQVSEAPEVARQKFLETVFEHDDKRLRIVEVIHTLIDEYQIEGKFRDDLIGYSNTFDQEIRTARQHVHSLDDYKSYDFRFSAVYMAMMLKFNESPEFRKRMEADMKDPDTSMGRYLKEMDESYAVVLHEKYRIQNIYSIHELENAITHINEEISSRDRAEL